MKWSSFNYRGTVYDLSHLDDFEWFYIHTIEGQPDLIYKCQVIFSSHCFTRDRLSNEPHSPDLIYPDCPDGRIFELTRYGPSKELPGIVRSLGERQCWHTSKGNYFTIDLLESSGETNDYEVYFKVSRASRRGWLNIQIQSAYVRDEQYQTSQPKKRKIGFNVIARNTQRGKIIKPPR